MPQYKENPGGSAAVKQERATMMDGSAAPADRPQTMPRNLDNIPGMAYYAVACDILASHEGRTDLPYAQACILAGLYAGQVAYPFTSHAWLSQASRACQMLVRTSKYESLPDSSLHKHLISFAFWTCQQLESDILAELDLPHSGLSRYESKVKFPDFLRVHNISGGPESPRGQILVLYLTQIVLRNVLNGTHTHLYKADDQTNGKPIPLSKVTAMLHFKKTLAINLEEWRQSLPPLLRWNDGDPPSEYINIARMRAKYYGARYIIHRPLLHHALHSFTEGSEQSAAAAAASPSSVNSAAGAPSPRLSARLISQIKAMDSEGIKQLAASFGTADNDDDDQDIQTIKACCICIDSAFHSTTAFDGLKGRPIVTNIFGTAHAQFGNMLVLSAAYNSPLRPLVDGDKLLALLNRTIKFLSQNRYISPTLRRDADILSSIKRKMFDKQSPRFDSPY
ncbi:hypothetical protein KEM52_006298 [Ascosphaera acerosa]|nr:hypothetical protein KEM52_006298 [Ascosphaera acerosa]